MKQHKCLIISVEVDDVEDGPRDDVRHMFDANEDGEVMPVNGLR